MCSQECMAKMKILCLNTVQGLFRDAFDRFSSEMAGRSLTSTLDPLGVASTEGTSSHPIASDLSGLSTKPGTSKGNLDHQKRSKSVDHYQGASTSFDHCQRASTSFDKCQGASTSFDDPNNNDGNCLNCSSDEHPANDQNCQNQLNNQLVGQFDGQSSGQQSGQQSGQSSGSQALASRCTGDRRSLSQLVLCNLMQNLVDTINEQCVKQLPSQMKAEKKRRKRKRKRKKSKANEIPDDQPNELEGKQMRRTQTNDQMRPVDKISADNSCTSKEATDRKHKRAPADDQFVRAKCTKCRKSRSNSADDIRRSDRRPDERPGTSAEPGRPSANRQHDERSLKRKRDESPSYKEKRRITSARKRPTTYKRKRLSSASSSCSDGSSASSTDVSSSDDEYDRDD